MWCLSSSSVLRMQCAVVVGFKAANGGPDDQKSMNLPDADLCERDPRMHPSPDKQPKRMHVLYVRIRPS